MRNTDLLSIVKLMRKKRWVLETIEHAWALLELIDIAERAQYLAARCGDVVTVELHGALVRGYKAKLAVANGDSQAAQLRANMSP